jgi:uncharacterized protein YbaR (Trm112 family)/SAM-dependent methyltransferase
MLKTSTRTNKLAEIMACPQCEAPFDDRWSGEYQEDLQGFGIKCNRCGASYPIYYGMPSLIPDDSPVFEWYDPTIPAKKSKGAKGKLMRLRKALLPAPRVWSKKSQAVVQRILEEKHPDKPENTVILIGSGHESVYQQILAPYHDIIRCGLAHDGRTDLACDVCKLPFVRDHADLIIASSVHEHVYDAPAAVAEEYRVLKPGGLVYTEIPFMRAYHMAPIDYQRYTPAGIRALHEQAGFTTLEVGICSGPFTALALFLADFARALGGAIHPSVKLVAHLAVSLAVHPMKYLDRLFENAEWAEIPACNFYYLGVKEG